MRYAQHDRKYANLLLHDIFINVPTYMNNYAYNYNTSKILNNYADEPILYLEGGITPLLFLNKDYIHADKYKKCLTRKKNDYSNFLRCIKTLKPNSLISFKNSEFIKDLKCSTYPSIKTSRNPLKFKKENINICNITNTEY